MPAGDELLHELGYDILSHLMYFEVTFCDQGPRDFRDMGSRDIAFNAIAGWRIVLRQNAAELNGDASRIMNRISAYESWLSGRESYDTLMQKLRN